LVKVKDEEKEMSVLSRAGLDSYRKAYNINQAKGGMETYEGLRATGLGVKPMKSGTPSLDVSVPTSELIFNRQSEYEELSKEAKSKKDIRVASNTSLKDQVIELSNSAEADEMKEVTGNSVYNFIANQEKFRASAYPDGKKRYSIGYGTIGKKGQTITEKEAYSLMVKEANVFKENVLEFNKKHNTGLNDNQIDALTSFAYTTGKGGLRTLFDGGNRNKEEIGEALKLYNRQEGKVLEGLNTRREAEYKLFTEGYSQ
jgi:GH24 family phage-related lysozyme (muramidase)|tara:strand:+ start:150 stop:920 length:771 start_codon:yes stop_codon:yes gene_type:complete